MRLLVRGGEGLIRAFKERLLQEVIDRCVQRHLGERRSGYRGPS